MDLENRHILVTGAGRRLGKAMSEYFLEKGAKLTAHTFQSDFQSNDSGKQAFSAKADLRNVEEVKSLAAKAIAHFGPVDILINSASDFFATRTGTCTESQWDSLHDLNLKAPYFLAQACFGKSPKREGCLINLCDIHVALPLKNFSPYSSTKGGLWTLTRSLAAEWAPHVRVNSVSPGTVLPPDSFTEQQIQRESERALLGRIGTAHDIVEAVAFLLRNDYVTGFDLKVDGGTSIK